MTESAWTSVHIRCTQKYECSHCHFIQSLWWIPAGFWETSLQLGIHHTKFHFSYLLDLKHSLVLYPRAVCTQCCTAPLNWCETISELAFEWGILEWESLMYNKNILKFIDFYLAKGERKELYIQQYLTVRWKGAWSEVSNKKLHLSLGRAAHEDRWLRHAANPCSSLQVFSQDKFNTCGK